MYELWPTKIDGSTCITAPMSLFTLNGADHVRIDRDRALIPAVRGGRVHHYIWSEPRGRRGRRRHGHRERQEPGGHEGHHEACHEHSGCQGRTMGGIGGHRSTSPSGIPAFPGVYLSRTVWLSNGTHIKGGSPVTRERQ